MDRNIFSTRARIVERHERAVVIMHGLPARPVIVPLANVDLEPIGFMDAPCGQEGFYRFTMARDVAKDIGLTV